ncbi:hypothetical protein B0I33_107145 [Prauserella shujinwangii]|uniref:Serine aminopeptidase S33 family n=1 Tax=Prauserella shujinwangii TaxID=1453103 RepID=A0A2T0LSD2_9PSEU|nr:hypothetical protein [Prauserella shujinwangii]PRX46568.1 hypothetical protein B0I33_107145 [Prauserella shujinwangii]
MRAGPALPRLPAAPVAVAVSAVALLVLAHLSLVGGAPARPAEERTPALVVDGPDPRAAVLFIAGYDSWYSGKPVHDRIGITRYSYAGLGQDGRPLPYHPIDTHASLDASAANLRAQIDVLHRRTGKPVAVMARSEGTLVVRTFLARYRHPHLESVVLLSPLVRPGRVYFPPQDARAGWGLALGWELRGMLSLVRWTSGAKADADSPLVRSVLNDAPLYRNRMLCPEPGVRMIAFVPLVTAAVVSPADYPAVPSVQLPGLHASMLGRMDIQRAVADFLAGRRVDGNPSTYYPAIQMAAAAWQAPALPLKLNAVWERDTPDAAFGDDGCLPRPR